VADDLREILDLAKRSMPDVPDEVWKRFEQLTRINFGAQRMYIASQKKGRHLALLEQTAEQDAQRLSQMLGLSVRQTRRLKKLRD
jgi:hypothetical protein